MKDRIIVCNKDVVWVRTESEDGIITLALGNEFDNLVELLPDNALRISAMLLEGALYVMNVQAATSFSEERK
jgi:hypothetical protein